MKEWAELLHGIGALLWPIGAMVALLVFKGDIRALAARLRRGKLLGQVLPAKPDGGKPRLTRRAE